MRESLTHIPKEFRSTITVAGVRATEIYSFSEALGVTIEQEIVRTLNDIREEWDPEEDYSSYEFVRQAQNFPDVLLRHETTREIIMGIELKSWYLLAKEGEPSFRFKITPKACEKQDFLVVVPWTLTGVIGGTPIIYKPYIELAQYMAEYRNYWWQHLRKAETTTEIVSPTDAKPYPDTRDEVADEPAEDKGSNFGRIARMGLMDEYVRSFDDLDLLGIELHSWREFFKSGGNVKVGPPKNAQSR
ncbi:MAG: hypothetical protein ABSC50_02780 [Candidatus Bathyarchaeia archaeon]